MQTLFALQQVYALGGTSLERQKPLAKHKPALSATALSALVSRLPVVIPDLHYSYGAIILREGRDWRVHARAVRGSTSLNLPTKPRSRATTSRSRSRSRSRSADTAGPGVDHGDDALYEGAVLRKFLQLYGDSYLNSDREISAGERRTLLRLLLQAGEQKGWHAARLTDLVVIIRRDDKPHYSSSTSASPSLNHLEATSIKRVLADIKSRGLRGVNRIVVVGPIVMEAKFWQLATDESGSSSNHNQSSSSVKLVAPMRTTRDAAARTHFEQLLKALARTYPNLELTVRASDEGLGDADIFFSLTTAAGGEADRVISARRGGFARVATMLANELAHQASSELSATTTMTRRLNTATGLRHRSSLASGTSDASSSVPPPRPLSELPSHTLIFVGGLGGSGTSFLRHVLASNNLTSGQDSCLQYKAVNCKASNEEGQWLLHTGTPEAKELRSVYSPGDSLTPLTESNSTGVSMLRYLWKAWSRYWDMSKPFLVEKSPPNLLKTRFLAAVFSLARSCRFLLVVRDPVTNSRFNSNAKALHVGPNESQSQRSAWPQRRGDNYKHEGAERRTAIIDGFPHQPTELSLRYSWALMRGHAEGHRRLNREKNGGLEVDFEEEEEERLREEEASLLLSRLAFARLWVRAHETLLLHLQKWPNIIRSSGGNSSSSTISSVAAVRVIRYEQVGVGIHEAEIACRQIYLFAFTGAAMSEGDIERACSLRKSCAEEKNEARLRTRKKKSSSGGAHTQFRGRRRLKYRGGDCSTSNNSNSSASTAHFKIDTASAERLLSFRRFLEASPFGSRHSAVTAAALGAIEPRLRRLGYSITEPGGHRAEPGRARGDGDGEGGGGDTGDEGGAGAYDLFAPWSISTAA